MKKGLTVRDIVIAGVLGAVAILLGVTRLGYIPVPTAAGNATIMHIPAIIGGIMQGPVVGLIVGAIFGISSFLNATVPLFKDPLVAILPRLFIGVVAWLIYVGIRRKSEYLAVGAAAFIGTLANTVLVLTMAVIRHYLTPGVAWTVGITNGIPEAIVGTIVTLAVVLAWKQIGKGQKSKISRDL
ncbi:ECF transporter S component [Neobacillus sp. MM2021_6]|uniref:ECF transporter S component n=1 Tax=Bacillaceae TaxID=186817 RepID=UPI00140B4CE5|nr:MULTISPECIES: ECF transporter S component [Bacillaceae]MBO0960009.1 ECF transporter S component [Neobacillus sp. MM2021_6]NHC18669.1 ECF transporter S component [Bacillus sp. MM2020_4]WML39557.1 ECF transporter S component [Neobacillus sp. OS1-2]